MQIFKRKNGKFSAKKIVVLALVVGLIGAVGFAYSNAAASVKVGYNNQAKHQKYKGYVAVHPSIYNTWKGTVCVKVGGYKFQRTAVKYKATKKSKKNQIYLYYTTKKGGTAGSMSKGACSKPKKSTNSSASSASKSNPCSHIAAGGSCPGGASNPKPPCKKSNNYKDCNRKELAQKILKHKNVGFDPRHEQDNGEIVGAQHQFSRLANGKKAVTTCLSPDRAVNLKHGILKFILSVAESGHYIRVTASSDRCHSSGSNHYKGTAVDLGCSTNASFSTLNAHAKKYGGRNNGEVCPGALHYHYDF